MASGNAACLHWPQQHYQLQLVESQLGCFGVMRQYSSLMFGSGSAAEVVAILVDSLLGCFGVMRQYSSLMFGSGSAAEVVAILQQKADYEVELSSQVTL